MDKNEVTIAIIGSGFSGIGLAIQLKKAGFHNFKIYEKAKSTGGTWRDNHYPGAACDVKSHLYSFSFELNPFWSREFSGYKEINEYITACIKKYDIAQHIIYDWEMTSAEWHNGWQIKNKKNEIVFAQFFVLATGPLHIPKLPDIQGIESFNGTVFHSSDWQHDIQLKDKKIGVIGTGASAIQFIPEIVPIAAELVVFQRTAPWILPKPDGAIAAWKQKMYATFPFLMKLKRTAIYWRNEAIVLGLVVNTNLMKYVENFSRSYIKRKVKNPDLQQKLIPNYRMGCKRILLTNNYLPVYNRENVILETNNIIQITGNKVITKEKQYELDVLICGTGFNVINSFEFVTIKGANGKSLQEIWGDFPQAYYGTMISGFPNLFLMLGPNTGLGNNSMIHMMESQYHFIIDYLKKHVSNEAKVFAVKSEAQEKYNKYIQQKLKNTVWSSGCKSWYILDTDRNPTVWPDFTFRYRKQTNSVDWNDFEEILL